MEPIRSTTTWLNATGRYSTVRGVQNSTPDSYANESLLVRVTNKEELKKYRFFRFQAEHSRQWLSRAIDTNAERSAPHEKIFHVEFVKKYSAYSIQGHTRMHLTCELNDRVTLDRMWARSFEMWQIEFDARGLVGLLSRRNRKFVIIKADTLVATADAFEAGSKWLLFADTSETCDQGFKIASGLNKKDAAIARETACWGVPPVAMLPSAPDMREVQFPLFGSPKPPKQLEPVDAKDHFDSVLIAQRTITNWASISGMTPLILADDELTPKLVEKVTKENGHRIKTWHPIKVDSHFEIQRRFSQPTYRGLFAKALQLFPEAPAVMYSNFDILYTPALSQTIRRVIEYTDNERERKLKAGLPYNVRGWLIVGQRVNVDVPVEWTIADAGDRWVDEILSFSKGGELFESDAEDYFVVSRGLFEWMKDIPDFVVGGVAFDNWIVNKVNVLANQGEAIVVDGTKTVTALHQNHGHNVKASHTEPKSVYNGHLAMREGWELGHTADALYATERLPDGRITVYDKHRLMYP